MKKACSLFLILTLCLSLGACGEAPAASAETAAPELNVEAPSAPETETLPQPTTEETTVPTEAAPYITAEEQLLLDVEDLKVYVTGIDLTQKLGPAVLLRLENNADVMRSVQSSYCTVNGCMMDPLLAKELEPGQSIEAEMNFFNDRLNLAGIEELADIRLSFWVLNNGETTDSFRTALYPVKTSISDTAVPSFDDSGELLYEDEMYKISYKGVDPTYFSSGPSVILLIENKTDEMLTFQPRDATLEGKTIRPSMSEHIVGHACSVVPLFFYQNEIEEAGVTAFTDLALQFSVSTSDIFGPRYKTEVIHFPF